jgi:glucose/mannose transport system substrate-binding protein
MRSRIATASAVVFGFALGCAACGSSPSWVRAQHVGSAAGTAARRPLVELFSWWTAPGEAEALQALVRTHKTLHPTDRVFNAAAASGEKAKGSLRQRLAGDDPPDLFQENIHDLRTSVTEGKLHLEPLDDLFDRLALRNVVFPEVMDDVTVGGHIVAMPVNLHRENSLFYNKRIFDKFKLDPPRSLADLLAICKTLKEGGVTPIATAKQGWIVRIMFNTIAMSKMGSERYYAYFTGHDPSALPLLREAVVVFKEILDQYTNEDGGEEGFGWTNAARAIYDGDAAMLLHGDWAKGYLQELGWRPGVDFEVTGAPGASDLFLYGVDVFAIPKGAKNLEGARDFLTTIASGAGQVAFNELKGSSPIRSDAGTGGLDAIARSTLEDLRAAQFRMRVRNRRAWDDAFASFARNRDVDALLHAFEEAPPVD